MDESEILGRGSEAQMLLTHPLLVEAFAAIEREELAAWRSSSPEDVEGREDVWKRLDLLREVRRNLVAHVERARKASHDADARQQSGVPDLQLP